LPKPRRSSAPTDEGNRASLSGRLSLPQALYLRIGRGAALMRRSIVENLGFSPLRGAKPGYAGEPPAAPHSAPKA
jgi:hypothetical protein